MTYRNPYGSIPPRFDPIRRVDATDTEVARTMQTDERGMIVDTSSGAATVTLPDVPCVPEGTEIFVRAQGAGAVTVQPIAGQRINDVADGTVAVPANTSGRFVRANNSYYT